MQLISQALNKGDPHLLEKMIVVVQRDPSLVNALISALSSDEPLIRRRAVEAVEKITRKHPDYLQPYKDLLIQRATSSNEPDLRLSLARLLPRLSLDEPERADLFAVLRTALFDSSDMLKVAALQALVTIAENDAALRSQAMAVLEEQTVTGIPANQRLARYERTRLSASGAPVEGQSGNHPTWRERRQLASQAGGFSRQYMKVAKGYYRELRDQEQEQKRRAPPTKKTLLKELATLFYAAFLLAGGASVAALEIQRVSQGPFSLFAYGILTVGIMLSLSGVWLLGLSGKRLVSMGVRWYQYKRAR